MNVKLYLAQRLSAAIMVPLIVIHIATILYATDAGLSAAEILSRTRGSIGWGLFYGLFVAAASVHAGIGVRTIVMEWTSFRGTPLDVLAILFALVLATLGMLAVLAVTVG